MSIDIILQGLSGLFWIITYILIIKKSVKDKTYGMPFLAMCLNLSWEFVFAFIYKSDIFHQIVCFIWFILDLIIACTFFKYGYKDFKKKYSLSKISFFVLIVFTLISSFVFMILAPLDFSILFDGDILQAAGFIAYFQNLLMSILFVLMFLERRNLKGQSIFIAIFKWLGTLSVSIMSLSGMVSSNPTELFVIFLIQFFDILYIYLLLKFCRHK
ncbi:transmembrane-type terpene cyclase [Faecalimicrobium dakarense]|uniref:transmembrane-type terpene cyclase n=1 Tax=Faecalimicrobium dakarense TaxID=1301100 RepID=UPI0004B807D7|nr:hypothetical protein [[Clostridium] dakarense]